jgi:replication initiation and membrane attachment protein DnaB
MRKNRKKRRNIVLGYKDAYLIDLIRPDDFKKFLEDSELKEKLDSCLNEIRIVKKS